MTFDRWQYLLLMGGCLLLTLPLELILRARVYRRFRCTALAIVPAVAVFAVWDWVAIARGNWSFAARYVTGIRVGVIPIEELAFFLAIPLCALLTFEAVHHVRARVTGDG